MVQQRVGNRIVAAETPVANVAELLERFGQWAWNRPCQRIAVEVLAAEHTIHTEFVRDQMVTLDRIYGLPCTWGP